LEQLYAELLNGHTDVKLFGFSEGAATVATFLWQLANDPQGTGEKMGSTPISEIKAAVLFECPNNHISRFFGDFDTSDPPTFHGLNNIPDKLSNAKLDIRLADVWNTASIVHGGTAKGWEGLSHSYDSRDVPQRQSLLGIFTRLINTGDYHGNILKSQYALNVMHSTFYPQ
jgi:hypothetical protein